MKKILIIVGSLRKRSMNLQCARALASDLEGKAQCTFLDFRNVPYMNEDIEFPPPESVTACRDAVRNTDGIWFVTPEYNHSFPGLLKNLVDWLSRPLNKAAPWYESVLESKKWIVTSVAGPDKGSHVIQAMEDLMNFVTSNAPSGPSLGIGYTREEDETSQLRMTPERMEELRKQERAFLSLI